MNLLGLDLLAELVLPSYKFYFWNVLTLKSIVWTRRTPKNIWKYDWLKSWVEMQEVSHGHDFCWSRNKITQIIHELSFYDVLLLNSTNLLMLGDNARS